jgi:hypothetical protein
MNKESTPMTTLFEYIEDGSKLHSIVSMKSVFMQYERVWLAKHLSQASNTDKADAIIEDIYKDEKK